MVYTSNDSPGRSLPTSSSGIVRSSSIRNNRRRRRRMMMDSMTTSSFVFGWHNDNMQKKSTVIYYIIEPDSSIYEKHDTDERNRCVCIHAHPLLCTNALVSGLYILKRC